MKIILTIKKYSDMSVKFEKSGDVYPAHTFILASQSEAFEKLNDNQYVFASDQDEESAKSLIKFFYTGTLEYTNETQLVTFMILANKLKVKNIGEFKVPPKVYLNGILAYVEKDLSNRISEFDSLVESVNFKKLEKEDLTKMYAKKKWLQKSSSFLNIIIMKDMDDDDEDGSDKSSEEEEEEEEEYGESGGGLPMIDLKASNTGWSYDKKTKYNKCSHSSWFAFITKKPTDKFTIELGSGVGSHMIGFIAKNAYQINGQSNYNNGYFWYTSSSSLYGIGNKLSFGVSGGSSQGMKFGCVFNRKKKGMVTFFKDNAFAGDAFSNIDKKAKLFPCVDCCTVGSQFKFIKGKFPKK